jgi:hypothetical protein
MRAIFTEENRPSHINGCSSHACLIVERRGMGTNTSKCYCEEKMVHRALRYLLQALSKKNITSLDLWEK